MSTFRFNAKAIGDKDNPKLNLKAGETWYFLLWLLTYLPRAAHLLEGGAGLLEAGVALRSLVELFQSSPPVLSRREIQRAWDHWLLFCARTREAVTVPKKHFNKTPQGGYRYT